MVIRILLGIGNPQKSRPKVLTKYNILGTVERKTANNTRTIGLERGLRTPRLPRPKLLL